MRKLIPLLVGLFLLSTFIACETETPSPNSSYALEGVWFDEHTTTYDSLALTSRLEYHFSSDSQVEVFRKIFDQSSGKLLGYQEHTYGNYLFEGDSLKMFNLQTYYHDYTNSFTKGYYSGLHQLLLTGQQEDINWRVSFDPTKVRATFHFPPCDDIGDCVNYIVLEKE